MKRALIVGGLGLIAFLTAADPGWAIPAFARKYQYSCTTCHAPAPRLKPFGEAFAARGFRLEDPSQEPTRSTIDTGDPLLRLARDFPLAARLEGSAAYKEGAEAEYDFEYPWAFKLLSGGPVSDSISYYFYYIIEGGGSGKLEDAYLQFNKPFGLPFNLLFGQFQICDPLFKRELRLERNDYAIFATHVRSSGIDLTYDRGLMALSTLPGDIDFILGVYNGNGINPANSFSLGRPGSGVPASPGARAEDLNFDRDSRKSFSARLARFIGPVRMGLFGYEGREDYAFAFIDDGEWVTDRSTNRVRYWGPDVLIEFHESLHLAVQYLERTDNHAYRYDPYGEYPNIVVEPATTRGGFAELTWLPNGSEGRWAVSLLYNKIDSDDASAIAENASVTVNYLLARNIRFLAEVENDFEGDRIKASIGVSAAF